MDRRTNITQLLQRASDPSVAGELLPLVYEELRALAASFMAARRAGQTLQPTAVVHEAYLKLVHNPDNRWESRAHFFDVAAKAMRQVLADHARTAGRLKRGGDKVREGGSAIEDAPGPSTSAIDYGELDDALTNLARLNARHARVVELRFYAGLPVEDCARILDVSPRTVEQDWKVARAFLRQTLEGVRG